MKNVMEWQADLKEKQAEEADRRAGVIVNYERSHYWVIERKAKRGKKKWIYVRALQATKKEIAAIFVKHFRNRKDKHRLRHIFSY